ncbi:valine--tRNA ligase isoform X2 [Halyomorpha halys]|uniref:valine--tRNA ligase isoform X2 n=1 Tax=Halyomorpha halys TaxID=286706 RepID=UPI0006D5061F|nr:valine--tRNA ligase-like isoform X2 [Halyomorpha halys]
MYCGFYHLQPTLKKINVNTIRLLENFRVTHNGYKPNLYEDGYYSQWNEKGLFKPHRNDQIYSVLLPPPNVTGTLHLGHALTISVQDTIARWKRMCQNEVIWTPGVDHAGIATQVAVEKSLMKQGISRFDVGKTKFLEEVWKWKSDKSIIISEQIKKLGASVDWEREFFTMDEKHVNAVTCALIHLFKKDLIYREESLINWSPHLRSVVSDIEVDYVDVDGPTALSLPSYSEPITFGKLVDFSYRVVGSDKEIVVSTTRIETMFGDVAIAVNPNDNRYKPFWGCKFSHPFIGSEIPLVLDSRVDPSFGTGAVKITPAHDPTDFQISKSHNLPKRSVINEEGVLQNCGKFSGMKRFEARESICNELASLGLLKLIRPHKMKIPICSRSGDVLEYLIKPQWFIKCKEMAKKAILAVEEKKLIITPENYQANWFHWLENIQDWCISRQLWWGHQLPFYYCEGNDNNVWVAAQSEEEALEKSKCYISGPVTINRDPDVLDTWFSSGILPFACFGWPEKTKEFKKYYPLSTLITGNDILFFWVARMVMLGLELTNELPFKEVFLHGIICDSLGRKMSKSLGNVIAPEDVINGKSLEELQSRIENSVLSSEEKQKAKGSLKNLYPEGIPECGIDALRFTLLSNNVKSHYINFDIKQCIVNKHFCNKMWQACYFADLWLKKLSLSSEFLTLDLCDIHQPCTLMENWILAKLNFLIHVVNKGIENGDFHLATSSLRNFIHLELCDIYIEYVKPTLQNGLSAESKSAMQTLVYALVPSLKCLSPFMPFFTEHLYQSLPIKRNGFIMETSYPTFNKNLQKPHEELIERVSSILLVINEIRRIKHRIGINHRQVSVRIAEHSTELQNFKDVIEILAKCKINFGKPNIETESWIKEFVVGYTTYFHQDGYKSKVIETSMLSNRKNKLQMQLDKLLEMSKSEGYQKNAPLKVKKSHGDKILSLKKEIEKLDLKK